MPLNKLAVTALAALLVGAVAVTSYAQDIVVTPDPALQGLSQEQAVAKRQEIMKLNGATMKVAGARSGDDAVKAAETLITNFSNLTVLFPEGSDTVPGSDALPAIWQNWETFEGLLDKGVTLATRMRAAAAAGDSTGYAAAVKSIRGLCTQCHDQFRGS